MMATNYPIKNLSRRSWLKLAPSLTVGLSLRSHGIAPNTAPKNANASSGWLLSGADAANGHPHLVAINPARARQFAWPLPGRAHDISLLPAQDTSCIGFCVARRPGNWLQWFDLTQGKLLAQITSPADSHFYGHAVSNADGSLLYATENHYQTPRRPKSQGLIGIYQTKPPFARVGQIDAGGLGPHQLLYAADKHQLIVANGGNITHPSTDREVLNLDSMQPNISYLQATTGKLLEQWEPADPHMSLRHIARADSGQLVIGVQDQSSARDPDAPVPLVLTQQMGSPLKSLAASTHQWLAARQYIASMASSPDGNFILASAPRANQLLLWSQGQLQVFASQDAAGIAWNGALNEFIASNSGGQLLRLSVSPSAVLTPMAQPANWHWDNHLFAG